MRATVGIFFFQAEDGIRDADVTGVQTCALPICNLVTAEEAFFADSVKYTSTVGAGGVLYATTSGVVGPTITVTADGWTARVSHTTTTKTCAIYVGSTALAPANKEGEPKCQ